MKLNNFQGELTDISSKKEALAKTLEAALHTGILCIIFNGDMPSASPRLRDLVYRRWWHAILTTMVETSRKEATHRYT